MSTPRRLSLVLVLGAVVWPGVAASEPQKDVPLPLKGVDDINKYRRCRSNDFRSPECSDFMTKLCQAVDGKNSECLALPMRRCHEGDEKKINSPACRPLEEAFCKWTDFEGDKKVCEVFHLANCGKESFQSHRCQLLRQEVVIRENEDLLARELDSPATGHQNLTVAKQQLDAQIKSNQETIKGIDDALGSIGSILLSHDTKEKMRKQREGAAKKLKTLIPQATDTGDLLNYCDQLARDEDGPVSVKEMRGKTEEARLALIESLPAFYRQYCDDYSKQLSFEAINEAFYSPEGREQRALLLDAFGNVRPVQGYERLVAMSMALEALTSPSPEVQAGAAKVLGQHGDHSAVVLYTLLSASQSPHVEVRREAATAFRKQGNKSFLVSILLMQLLDDSDAEVRGNAALALRDQAVTNSCPNLPSGMSGHTYQTIYYDPSTDEESSQGTIPACRLVKKEDVPDPLDENDPRAKLGAGYGCPEIPIASSNVFDRIVDLDRVRELEVLSNVCYLNVPRLESRVIPLARDAVFSQAINERDLPAKARMLAALRNLGEGDPKSVSLLTSEASGSDPTLRVSAIYALARAGKGLSTTSELVARALGDPDPKVRRAALGAVGELGLIKPQSASKSLLLYNIGREHFASRFKGCESLSGVAPDTSAFMHLFSDMQYVLAGFTNALNEKKSQCAHEQDPTLPALLSSTPENGEEAFRGGTFKLVFSGAYHEADLKSSIAVLAQASGLPIPLASFTVTPTTWRKGSMSEPATLVELTLTDTLVPNVSTVLKISGALKNAAGKPLAPGGEPQRIMFMISGPDVTGTVTGMMNRDENLDVRLSAAGLLLAWPEFEQVVTTWLIQRLQVVPSRAADAKEENAVESEAVRASRFFSPSILRFAYLSAMPEDERKKSVLAFVDALMANLNEVEPKRLFLNLPSLIAKHRVLADFISRGFFPQKTMVELLENRYPTWLWDHIAKVVPSPWWACCQLEPRPEARPARDVYPLWDRLLWSQVRGTWLESYDTLYKNPRGGDALQRLYNVVVPPAPPASSTGPGAGHSPAPG